jgi:hypothetical protein
MTARNAAGALAIMLGGALALGACTTGTPTTGPGGTASQPSSPTGGVIPSFDLGSFAMPSLNADLDLEALLPDDLGGEPVQKFSMKGDSFLGSGGTGTAELDAVLNQAGKTPADLSVAFAGTPSSDISLIAYRIKGVPAETFFQAFLAAAQQNAQVTSSDTSLGGKSVKKLVSTDTDIGTVYVYASGDVLFVIGGEDVSDILLNEAFAKLG